MIKFLKKLTIFASFLIMLFVFTIGSYGVMTSAAEKETFKANSGANSTPNTQAKTGSGCSGVSSNNDLCFLQPSNIDCIFQNEAKTCKFPFFDQILEFLKQIAPYVATLIIVVSGFEYFADKNIKETKALGTLQAAVIGLIIILIGPLISTVVVGTFSAKGFDPEPLQRLLAQLVDFLISISTFAAVLIIVIGGYVYFTEGFSGDGKSSKGKNLIVNGAIGLIVMLFARPVVTLLKDTFNSTTKYKTVLNGVEFVSEVSYASNPLAGFIQTLLSTFLIPISSVATVIFIVFGGYYWITSNGDQKRSEIALNLVKNAVIGLIVVLLSTTLVQLLLYFVKPTEFINRPTTSVTTLNNSGNSNFPTGGTTPAPNTNNTPAPTTPN